MISVTIYFGLLVGLLGVGCASLQYAMNNGPLTLDSNLVRSFIEMVSVGTSQVQQNRRFLQTGDLFSSYCNLIEATGEFQCDCDSTTSTSTCTSQDICSGEVCASFEIKTDFDSSFNLESIQICIEYDTVIEAAEFRDGCVSLFYTDKGETVTNCEIKFSLFMDNLVPCNSCDVCTDDGDLQGFAIDCSNIEENASTEGCVVIEDDEENAFFPGFRSAENTSGGYMIAIPTTDDLVILVIGLVLGAVF